MLDIKRFQQSMTAPSRVGLEKAYVVIEQNLTEMGEIVAHVKELLFLNNLVLPGRL